MSKLHEFDVCVCNWLHMLMHNILRDERFAKVLSRFSTELQEYLRNDLYPDEDSVAASQLLLSDGDFAVIYQELKWHTDFCRGDPPRSAADQASYREELGTWNWTWSPMFYQYAVRCLPEIKSGLTSRQAERWDRRSQKYEGQLKKRPLLLERGIKLAWNWVLDARELLTALGHPEFVPPPHGQYPTPHKIVSSPDVAQTTVMLSSSKADQKDDGKGRRLAEKSPWRKILRWDELETAYEQQLAFLRAAIKESPNPEEEKIPDLLKRSPNKISIPIHIQLARDLLRYLEWRGEYKGFHTRRSMRYPLSWPWIKEPFTGKSG